MRDESVFYPTSVFLFLFFFLLGIVACTYNSNVAQFFPFTLFFLQKKFMVNLIPLHTSLR